MNITDYAWNFVIGYLYLLNSYQPVGIEVVFTKNHPHFVRARFEKYFPWT